MYETVRIGGLPVARLTMAAMAEQMAADVARARAGALPPQLVFDINGQGLSMYADDADYRAAMDAADLIHADGQPLVLFSRWVLRRGLPERAATTDFYHTACQAAAERGLRFFLLGADGATIDKTAAETRRLYPDLDLVGWRSGYFGVEEEREIVADIVARGTDVLWIGMGKPREQMFALRNREALRGVGWLKTCGGLFDFVSGNNSRAPQALQAAGLEWAYRLALEPRRLFWRYARTNPHAVALMLRDALAQRAMPRGPAAADGG